MRSLSVERVEPDLLSCTDIRRLRGAWKLTWLARYYTQLTITGLSHDHLLAIAPLVNTNILWNLGHLIYSLDHMLYDAAGVESPLPDHYKKCFRPGVTPVELDYMPPPEEVLKEFDGQLQRVENDLRADLFKHYKPMEIAKGVRLTTLEDVLGFAAAHEGFHAGAISNLRDLVT